MKKKLGNLVVVTGAAHGIGAALTNRFLEQGTVVYGIDINETALNVLSLGAKKLGQNLQTITADISDEVSLRRSLQPLMDKKQPIDLWINNAGVSGLGGFMEKSLEEFNETVRINLGGVALGTRIALEHMEFHGRGCIVNVASVAGHISAPYLSAYSASKHAVVGFTRALRQELKLKDSPVKLTLVSPGFVDTKMIARGSAEGFPDWLAFLLSTPEDVAREIIIGLQKGDEEIFPTWNGKALIKMHWLFPRLTAGSSRLLLSKSLKDLILLRKNPP